ncbi:unnamed protein product [Closterium sp. NIES-65]|nr:unnamed protein product [Closterium sp. NIES-65]
MTSVPTTSASAVLTAPRQPLSSHSLFFPVRREGQQQRQLRSLGVPRRSAGVAVRASSKGESGQGRGHADEKRPLFSKDDGPYFAKALGGCVVGAVAIKYGSLFIVPQLTESPSLAVALTIIITPVVRMLVRQVPNLLSVGLACRAEHLGPILKILGGERKSRVAGSSIDEGGLKPDGGGLKSLESCALEVVSRPDVRGTAKRLKRLSLSLSLPAEPILQSGSPFSHLACLESLSLTITYHPPPADRVSSDSVSLTPHELHVMAGLQLPTQLDAALPHSPAVLSPALFAGLAPSLTALFFKHHAPTGSYNEDEPSRHAGSRRHSTSAVIPESLWSLTGLESLRLDTGSCCSECDCNVYCHVARMSRLTTLEVLAPLSAPPIQDTDSSGEMQSEPLKGEVQQSEEVKVKGVNLDIAYLLLPSFGAHLPSVTRLSLHSIRFCHTRACPSALLASLSAFPSLRHLSLSLSTALHPNPAPLPLSQAPLSSAQQPICLHASSSQTGATSASSGSGAATESPAPLCLCQLLHTHRHVRHRHQLCSSGQGEQQQRELEQLCSLTISLNSLPSMPLPLFLRLAPLPSLTDLIIENAEESVTVDSVTLDSATIADAVTAADVTVESVTTGGATAAAPPLTLRLCNIHANSSLLASLHLIPTLHTLVLPPLSWLTTIPPSLSLAPSLSLIRFIDWSNLTGLPEEVAKAPSVLKEIEIRGEHSAARDIAQLGVAGEEAMFAEYLTTSTGAEFLDPWFVKALEQLPATIRHEIPGLPLCVAAPPVRLFQARQRQLAVEELHALRRLARDDATLARFTSLQGPGAGAWVSAVPAHSDLIFTAAEWGIAAAIRLGLPIQQLQVAGRCVCGTTFVDPADPHHALRCRHQHGPSRVHDEVKFAVAKISKASRGVVTMEDSVVLHGKRVDVAVRRPMAGEAHALEISVADPLSLSPSLLGQCGRQIGVAAREWERRKTSDYAPLLARNRGVQFTPLIVETWGCLGGRFQRWLHQQGDAHVGLAVSRGACREDDSVFSAYL